MIGWDIHADMVWEGGALALAGTLGWAAQVGADNARHRGNREAYDALRGAANALPLGGPVTALPEVIARWADYNHYRKWTEAAAPDPLWDRISPAKREAAILSRGLPMLFVGGWFDFTLPGTLAAWRAIAAAQPDRTSLLVGPWPHLPWARSTGGVDFGEAAISDVDRIQIAWFDHWLKGGPGGMAPVRLFDLGTKSWRDLPDWGQEERRFHLGGDGRASVDPAGGWLGDAPGEDCEDRLVHDPWRPALTRGGRWGSPPGPVDRTDVDQRGDVLTFTGPLLEAAMAFSGTVRAALHVEADAPSFDLVCTVSRVLPDGRVQGFAEGVRRMTDVEGIVTVEVDLLATCITLLPGERLRLSIAGASFPAYAVNPGVGDPIATPQIEARVITLAVHHGEAHPSALILGIPRQGD